MAHRDFPPYQAVDFVLRNILRHVPPSSRAEQLALWWGSRFQARPRVVRLRGGSSMLVEPRDYLLMLLYYLGTFEPQCLRLLYHYLRPGGTMLDVGANLGLFSLTAAKIVGPRGRVISVEAVQPISAALRDNVALNHFDWVTIVEAAAWSGDGVATLGLPEAGNSGCYSVSANGGTTFEARQRRLDDILDEQRVGRVDVLKMDIEGAECEALRGASRLLAEHRPVIIIEFNEETLQRCGASSGELRGILEAAGYRGKVIGKAGMRPLGEFGPNDCLECLFLPTDRPAGRIV
jgi:FkbM family methyltransferase